MSRKFMENLEIVRIRRGMPKAELARRIGLTPGGLSQMLRRKSIRLERIEALAKALEVDPALFFEDKGSL
jgi:transcriptional regulator with XRE-family HTH domain